MTHFTQRLLTVAVLCGMTVAATAQTHNVNITSVGSFPSEISWELTDGVAPLASAACGLATVVTVPVTLVNGTTYTFNAFDDYGDGWNGGEWSITDIVSGCVLAGGLPNNGAAGDFSFDCIGQDVEQTVSFDPAAPISGCTDPLAINFNPCATVDDGSCISPLSNDACVDAIDIPLGTCYTGTNVGATFGGDTMGTACVDGSVTPVDIWFTTTVGASGNLEISFPIVPGISSIVELYAGCPASGDVGILAAAAICGNYGSGGSVVISGLTPGPITIRYYDFGSDEFGSLELCISEPVSGCTDICSANYDSTATIDDGSCLAPVADVDEACAAALTLPGDGSYSFFSGAADADTLDITSCTTGDLVAVYASYDVPVGIDTLKIWTCGSSFDTGLSLWDGCPSDTTSIELACNDDGQVAVDPTNPSLSACGGVIFQSAIILSGSTLDALEGTNILIRISGFADQSGCGDLNVETVGAPVCSSATPPQNPTSTNGGAAVALSWDAVPLSVACNVKGTRLTPPGPSPSVNIIGFEPTGTNVPYAAAGAGTTWEWSVRCACNISPVDATAFSAKDTFMVPNPKIGAQSDLVLELFPNPADNMLMVSYNAIGGEVNMSVVDMLGRTVISRVESMFEGANNTSIDVSSLEPAAYFLSIEEAGVVKTVNFTVVR